MQTRHVFYIQGFFPEGPSYYHRIFSRELRRYGELHGLAYEAGAAGAAGGIPEVSSAFAMKVHDADGEVATTYEFLLWDDFIRAMTGQGWGRLIPQAASTLASHLGEGVLWRFAATNWRFLLAWIYPYVAFLTPLWAVPLAGWLFWKAFHGMAWLVLPGLLLLAGAGMLVRFASGNYGWTLAWDWVFGRDLAKGRVPLLEARLDAFARRLVEVARAGGADEVLVVAHSFGACLAPMVLSRALDIEPALGRIGSPVALLTCGDVFGQVGYQQGSGAEAYRQAVARLAVQDDIPWVLAHSRKDIFNFMSADPIRKLRLTLTGPRRWPVMFHARFRDMMPKGEYRRFRWRFFRVHAQFILAARVAHAPYDYFELVMGRRRFAAYFKLKG